MKTGTPWIPAFIYFAIAIYLSRYRCCKYYRLLFDWARAIKRCLGQYYSNTDTQTKRFQKFVTGVLHDENSNWVGTNNQKFEQEVYDDLALTYDPTTKTINDYSSSVDIINKNLKKFAILTRGSSSFPSFKIRKFVARSFIDYVEARI